MTSHIKLELPSSNIELCCQEDLSTMSFSTSGVSTGESSVPSVSSFQPSPFPVLCVKNTAVESSCDLLCKPVSQVDCSENLLEKKPAGVFPLSKSEGMDSHQLLTGHLESERAVLFYTDSAEIKPVLKSNKSSGKLERRDHLNIKTGCVYEWVPGRSKSKREGHLDISIIKTECSNELIPGQKEGEVGDLDVKSEFSMEFVPGQSDRQNDHVDVKTEFSNGFFEGHRQSEGKGSQLDIIKTERLCEHIPEQSDVDIKTEHSVEHFPRQLEQSIISYQDNELDEELYGDSYTKKLGVLMQQYRTQPPWIYPGCRDGEGDSAQTMCVNDIRVPHLRKSAFASNQQLGRHVKGMHKQKQKRNVKKSAVEIRQDEDLSHFGEPDCKLSKSTSCCSDGEKANCRFVENDPVKELELRMGEYNSSNPEGSGQKACQRTHLSYHSSLSHQKDRGFVECCNCGEMSSQETGCIISLTETKMEGRKGGNAFKCSKCNLLYSMTFDGGERMNQPEVLEGRNGESSQSSPLRGLRKMAARTQICTSSESSFMTFSQNSDLHKDLHNDMRRQIAIGEKSCKHNERGTVTGHTKEKPFKCDACDKTFVSRNCLLIHKKRHAEEQLFKCDTCDKTFVRSSNLLSHMRTHTGENPFKCIECGKTFCWSSTLHKHMRTHTGKRPLKFKCDECGRSFCWSSTLRKHMRTHTGKKTLKFKCNECGQTFCWSSALHKHMRKHTGEKPFICDVCGQAFGWSSNLQSHMRKHTGEQPFKCDVCDKTFSESGNLHSHRRTHIGERPFKCDMCDATFSDSSHLQTHMKTYRGGKSFNCNECGKKFCWGKALPRHICEKTQEKSFSNVMNVVRHLDGAVQTCQPVFATLREGKF